MRRGYILGIGVISSKQFGINHKEYGVTSTGVITFAEITMAELGIDMRRDSLSVKFTGGPAAMSPATPCACCSNAPRRSNPPDSRRHRRPGRSRRGPTTRPWAAFCCSSDIDAFDPAALHAGGFILYRTCGAPKGCANSTARCMRTAEGLRGVDHRRRILPRIRRSSFNVPADLFIPAGGRPETIDGGNWQAFLRQDGTPSARAIVEGANSFITPDARVELQQQGVIMLRDASANKCGVISSSYEIIANLLLSEKEFLAHKERYVADVLEILEKRAEDEARLIFRRQREAGGACCYTEISAALSTGDQRPLRPALRLLPASTPSCARTPFSTGPSSPTCRACCARPPLPRSGSNTFRPNTGTRSSPPRSPPPWSTGATRRPTSWNDQGSPEAESGGVDGGEEEGKNHGPGDRAADSCRLRSPDWRCGASGPGRRPPGYGPWDLAFDCGPDGGRLRDSSPELAVSVLSAWSGQPGIALGNVVGSNICNVLLILGLSALAAPLVVSRRVVRQEVSIMIAVSALLFSMASSGTGKALYFSPGRSSTSPTLSMSF